MPLDADRSLHALLDRSLKLIRIRIPSSTPTLRHYQLAVDINLHVAGIVEDELVETIGRSLYISLIYHLRPIQGEALRQVLDATLVGLLADFRSLWHGILEVDTILATYYLLTILVGVSTGQLTFLAILVIEFERAVQLEIILWITPTAV